MYLGLDIGTSGVKAVLVDDAQNIVDQATAPLTVNRPVLIKATKSFARLSFGMTGVAERNVSA